MQTSLETLTPLDIGLDEESLKPLLDTLKVLSQFQITFDDQRAVCQAQIKTLIDECNVALDDRYPLQSFTQRPSPQNLAVVTEGILTASAHKIAELAEKVWALIKKIARWILEALRKLFSQDKAIRQRVQLVHILSTGNDELAKAGGVHASTVAAPVPQGSMSDEAYAKIVAAYHKFDQARLAWKDNITALDMDLLKQGPALGVYKAAALTLPNYIRNVVNKTVLVNQYLVKEAHNGQDLSTRLNGLKDDLPIPQALQRASQAWTALHDVNTMPEYLENLKTATHSLASDKPHGVMEWYVGVKVVTDPRSGFDEPLIPLPNFLTKTVDDLEQLVAHFTDASVLERIQPEQAAVFERVLMTLVKEVKSLTDYAEGARTVLSSQFSIVSEALRVVAAQYELNVAITGGDNDSRRAEILLNMRQKLRETMTHGGQEELYKVNPHHIYT